MSNQQSNISPNTSPNTQIQKILVLGSGCREYSIITKLLRDNPDLSIHYSAPSQNYILSKIAYFIDINFIKVEFLDYDLIIAGPEKYCGSFLDKLFYDPNKTLIWGPRAGNETLEYSKAYTRNFIHKYLSNNSNQTLNNINPNYHIFDNLNNITNDDELTDTLNDIYNICQEYISNYGGFVIKPDGLTGGKGVKLFPQHFLNDYLDEAITYMKSLNETFIIEELLNGNEYSLMAFTDGQTLQFMPQVQDYKRAYNNNLGPNTGSMGSVCMGHPNNNLYFLTDDDIKTSQNIMKNTISLLENENYTVPYVGVLYGSFIKTLQGEIKLIEYNVRLGDPECINVMDLLETPLLDIISASCNGILSELNIKWYNNMNTVVYLTPYDYPSVNPDSKPVNYPNMSQSFLNDVVHARLDNYNLFEKLNQEQTSRITYYTNDLKYIQGLTNIDYIPNKSRTCCFCISNNNLEDLIRDYKELFNYLDLNINKYNMKYTIRYRNDILDTYIHNKGQYIYSQQGGVDTQTIGNTLISVKDKIASTYSAGQVSSAFGSFGGEYILPHGHHTLVASTDGVGTKTIALRQEFGIARAAEIAGQDIVNHNINDILVNGGVPLFFLDYFGCAEFNKDEFEGLINGITTSCRKYDVVLLGGETAVMRDVYRSGEIDIVGTIVGRKEFTFYRQYVAGEDILVGLDASGFHTNGFSFLRKIWHEDFKHGMTESHRCYLNEIRDLLHSGVVIKGMSHITGGGFYDNINRVIPREQYNLDIDKIDLPGYYKHILDAGYSKMDCMEILNCGVGMVIIINKNDFEKVKTRCEDARIIGYVI